MAYGTEFILDLYDCSTEKFNRKGLTQYLEELCELIDMERCDLHFWDYKGSHAAYKKAPDHLKGTSAIQFILTSNITIHTLDVVREVMINIFSCKHFNHGKVRYFTREFFKAKSSTEELVIRGKDTKCKR